MEKQDLIILGAGPAGMTAQIYAIRYNLKSFIIGQIPGGLMMESHKIGNFPGESFVSGVDLTQKMLGQVKEMGGEVVMDEVADIQKEGDNYKIITRTGKEFLATRIIFALGTKHKALNLENEKKLVGRGVAYCATCDAMFYRDKITAVAGSGNSAITAALHLSEVAEQVYLIFRSENLKGEPAWMNELKTKKNVTLIPETNVIELVGEEKLEKIILDKEFNGKTELNVAGLFIEIGTMPQTELFKKLGGELDEQGYIKVDREQKTSLPNIWAAGDVTNASNNFRQIITACAEAAVAVNSIFQNKQKS
ncbi:MAG: FAD-dependent oxidoreductase [bacterium]